MPRVVKRLFGSRLAQILGTLRASLRMSWDAAPSTLITTAAFAVVMAVIPVAMVWLGKRLVDQAVAGSQSGQSDLGPLTFTVVAFGVAAAALKAVSSIQGRRITYFASVVEWHAEHLFLEKAATTDFGYFDQPEWYDRAARATRDLHWRPYNVANSLVGLVGAIFSVVGMLALLCTLSPLLALLGIVAVLPSAATGRWLNQRWYRFWTTTTTDERHRTYLRDLLSMPEAAKEIRAYDLAGSLGGRYRDVATRRLQAMRRLYRGAEKWQVVAGLVSGLALALAYALVATRAVRGEISLGELTVVIGAFAAATAEVGRVLSALFELDQNATFLDDYFSFLQLEPLLPVADDPTALPAVLEDGLRLENVTFSYSAQPTPALHEVSLHVAPGEMLALVGANGAGKTTLVKLLLRFYDPDEGRITLGGVDLRDADPKALRDRIGVLFQDFFRYDLTVRDNLCMGRVSQEHTDEEIWAALEAADATEIVEELPLGLESHVGRRFEDGHDLSGGQWQRLALARLFLRDADIWVLDEPVSALDPESEAAIITNLQKRLEERIGIVISHRMSSVRMASKIAVLDGGRVVELGNHDELVAAGGRYAHLFDLQATPYR